MRMFAALVPPDEALDDLERFLEPRREHAAFRWTAREQWHLTLAFYAQVPDRSLDELVERLTRAAAKRRRTTLRIAGGGAFPHVARAKVLWAGVDAPEEVRRLATGTRAAASRSGVPVDGARFTPHLTLARMGHPVEASSWVRLLDTYSGPQWQPTRLSLIASHLGEGARGRPRYELIAQVPISSDEAGPTG